MSDYQEECLFCSIAEERIVMENEYCYAMYDGFPVTPLHALIIPKRHAIDYFELSNSELLSCHALIQQFRKKIIEDDPMVQGFNIGMNAGAVSGQTIFHCHIHLIPRRKGDVENPRGGIRHLIPGKGFY